MQPIPSLSHLSADAANDQFCRCVAAFNRPHGPFSLCFGQVVYQGKSSIEIEGSAGIIFQIASYSEQFPRFTDVDENFERFV